MKRRVFSESKILRTLDRGAEGLYDSVSESAFGRGLTSYDSEKRGASRSLIAVKAGGLFSGINFKKVRSAVSREIENSAVLRAAGSLFGRLASSYLRQYGAFAFAFGFYGAVMYFFSNYAARFLSPLPISHLAVCCFIMVLSIPMMFVKRTAAEMICRSKLANVLLFRLLGLRRESLAEMGKGGKRINFSIIIGTLLGLMTAFVSPLTIVKILICALAAAVVLCSPESGLILTVLLIPFGSTAQLGYILMFITLSFTIKTVRGKRSIVLDLKDWGVVLLAAVVLFGGIISLDPSSSFSYAVKLFFYMTSYVLTVNLVRSRKWLNKLKAAIIISCTAATLGGLFQVVTAVSPHFVNEGLTEAGGVTSFFASRESLSEFLVLGLFFILSEMLENSHKIRKLFFLMLGAAVVSCIWFADFAPAMLAGLIAALLFFLIYSHRTLIIALACAIVVPAVGTLLPLGIYTAWKHISGGVALHAASNAPLVSLGTSMAGDHLLGGVGLGGFRTLFSQYANESVSYAVTAPTLYLQILIEIGLFGLILFLCVMFLFAQNSFSLFASRGGGKRTLDTAAGVAGIAAMLVCGFADNIWYDEKLFLCFWIVMGISSAAGSVVVEEDRGKNRYLETL